MNAKVLPTGTKIWVPDERGERVWVKAAVAEVLQEGIRKVRLEETEDEVGADRPLPAVFHLRNEDTFTDEEMRTLDDLTRLTHLHEPAVLHCINERFDVDSIYTLTGPILIAINPFKAIPGLYEGETLKYFIDEGVKQTFTSHRTPHVFSTAIDAYKGLCREEVNQTILISGESGAGKTESTKFVMKLLALAGSQDWTRRSYVENQVLQSNPLLEAFGNAKTLRNDNSSRFGKFIEMQFKLENDAHVGGTVGRLAGARIQTYLLETVRVCRQLGQERNYHAFYQLASMGQLAGGGSVTIGKEEALEKFGVEVSRPIVYDLAGFDSLKALRYVSCSGCQTLKGVLDEEEFKRTALAMETVGISREDQQQIWSLVGTVLILGGVYFDSPAGNSEGSEVALDAQAALSTAAQLLGVTERKLSSCLCSRTITVQKEKYRKPLTVEQAEDARDALARALYGTMFLEIVRQTNKSIGYQKDTSAFCGVLDIFGFECFEINSFEQLCINFTNERLQQFFNTFIFKCEEELYQAEGISWDPLDFPDNQDCVTMLSNPRNGLFAMLDEECVIPKGSDANYCSKLKTSYKDHHRFSHIKTKQDWFTVNHFAGPVHYCVKGFLDKNRDQMSADTTDAVKESSNGFIAHLFLDFLDRREQSKDATANKTKRPVTVSSEFRNQLNVLMNTVQVTAPHFIRCIKPNPSNLPNNFHRKSVVEQLRYGGVLQAVQVSRAGFPVRHSHEFCWQEYRCILEKRLRASLAAQQSHQERARQMLAHLDQQLKFELPKHSTAARAWEVGNTLVFLKQEAFGALSTARVTAQRAAATAVQKVWLGARQRRWFRLALDSVRVVQRGWRCAQARAELGRRRREWAALAVQRRWRGVWARAQARKRRGQMVLLQRVVQAYLQRLRLRRQQREVASQTIQAWWRGGLARQAYGRQRRAAVAIALSWKGVLARRELKRLRQEARNVGSLHRQKDALQQELQSVKARLAQALAEQARLEKVTQEKLLEAEAKARAADLAQAAVELRVREAEAKERETQEGQRAVEGRLEALQTAAAEELAEAEERLGAAEARHEVLRSQWAAEQQRAQEEAAGLRELLAAAKLGDGSSPTSVASSSVGQSSPPTTLPEDQGSSVTDEAASGRLMTTSTTGDAQTPSREKLEMQLAEVKKDAHEGHELLQSICAADCPGYLNKILDVVRLEVDEAAEPALRGDMLIISDHLALVAEQLLLPLRADMIWDDCLLSRLDALADDQPLADGPRPMGFFRRREFDVYSAHVAPHPIRLLVLTPADIQAVQSASNQTRLRRHFRFVLFCLPAPTCEQALPAALDELRSRAFPREKAALLGLHVDSAQLVLLVSDPGSAPAAERLPENRLVLSAQLQALVFESAELPDLVRFCALQIKNKREELAKDLIRLRETLAGPGALGQKPQSPLARSPSALSELVVSGLSLLFHGRAPPRPPGRPGKGNPASARRPDVPSPAEILSESLLTETPSPTGTDGVVRWQTIHVPNKTAVTYLKFSDLAPCFFLLVVATKGGLIYTYKILKTARERTRRGEPAPPPSGNEADEELARAWQAEPSEPVEKWNQLEGHDKAVTSLTMSHDGITLISTSIDCSVRFWDIRTGQPTKIFTDSVAILVAAFLPTNPRYFITSNVKGILRVVDSVLGNVDFRLKVESEIRAICFDTSGLNLIAGTKSGTIVTYQVEDEFRLVAGTGIQISTQSEKAAITCVLFCPSSPSLIIANSCDNQITLLGCNYSLHSVALTNLFVKQRLRISHLCIPLSSCINRREEYTWLFSGSEEKKVRVFAQQTACSGEFKPVTDLKGHDHAVLAVDCSPLGTLLASADVTGAIILWRRATSVKTVKV